MSIDKPEVDFPGGEPPADLEIKDIWEGDGPVAKAGDTVQVHYVGVAFSTGEEFDASWNRGTPLGFQLGAGQVIAGWDQGVQGMKVGGRRQLTIPAHLAYGDRGAGGGRRRKRRCTGRTGSTRVRRVRPGVRELPWRRRTSRARRGASRRRFTVCLKTPKRCAE